MMLEKNRLIVFGALVISLLLNFPRLLIMLSRADLVEEFGFTYSELLLRTLVMFVFSWTVLSYNIDWKTKLNVQTSRRALFTDIAVNTILLLLGVCTLTFLKQFSDDFILDTQSYFFVSFFIYLVVLIILLLLSWLYHLTNRHQQSILEKELAKQKALHHQLEVLRSQINPHFLFNTLNSLNSLIRQKSAQASVFVDKLSLLLRATLQQSDKDYISLQEELSYLEAYIFLQKERFGEKLSIEITIPEAWKNKSVPSFSLQLLVENAIKHNVVSQKQPLKVEVFTAGKYLVVSNPVQKRRDSIESTGKGLRSLSTRFKILKNEDIQIEETTSLFLVKLPVV